MMGYGHAVSGAAVWLAACAPAGPVLTGLWPDGWQTPGGQSAVWLGLTTLLGAGAALLPDLDHPKAVMSNAVPVISQVASKAVRTAAGGRHRGAAHCLIAAGLFAAGAWLAPLWAWRVAGRTTRPGTALLVALILGSAVAALRLKRSAALSVIVLAAAAGAFAGAWFPVTRAQLAAIVAAGTVTHLAGDCLTVEGVPLLWPWRRRFRAAALGHAGSGREHALVAALACYCVWVLVAAGLFHAQNGGWWRA
jgi:membrane-bound metal-dependent hydrolase YbcI (DUF457 family)